MMNLTAISLMFTSLAVSGLFSPIPRANEDKLIIKDGHRAVVVEFEDTSRDDNTKVSISPPHAIKSNDDLSRATASVAGVAQDVKGKAKEVVGGGPRELICDAYGKCKHKVAGVLGMAKESVDKVEETAEEFVGDAVDMAKGFASRATGKVQGTVEEAKETGERLKGKTGEKVREAGQKVRETGEKVTGKTEEVVEEVKEKGREGKKELSGIAKRGKEVVSDVMRYVFRVDSMGKLMNLMGFAMAYGFGFWVTFLESYVLAGVLPRQQFGMVQSKVYPVYFKAMAGGIGLALLGHRGNLFKSKSELLQVQNLLTCLLMVFANLLYLEPRATKVMFERMKLEKEEGRGRDHDGVHTRVVETVGTDATMPVPTTVTATTVAPTPARREDDQTKIKLTKLNDRLKKLNSYSSLLNVSTLVGLTWHLVHLSRCLGVNC